jgi:Tfp pilus assembly protein PilN
VLALLAVALGFVTVYVLTSNKISQRKAELATVNAEVGQAQSQAAQLANYASFAQLAQTRAQTVREIAATRFDWYGALSDLSRVVPANTSLQSLFGSVAPGAAVSSSGGGAAGAGSSLRSDMTVPAFDLAGCTKSQDDVARLMSRLRVIHGVTRVTLSGSQKSEGAQAGTSTTSAGPSTTSASGCGPNAPTFDIVAFFSPLPGAGPNGVTSASAQPVSTSSPSAGGPK